MSMHRETERLRDVQRIDVQRMKEKLKQGKQSRGNVFYVQ